MLNSAESLISLIDLTSLNDSDDASTIISLCMDAQTPKGNVAAVCVYPQFVSIAKATLEGTGIQVATVANFPTGEKPLEQCLQTIKQALRNGANEIDVVLPYHDFLSSKREAVSHYLAACRTACTPSAHLKVILETGALKDESTIQAATTLAIDCGANFIKTSTGKIETGATLAAAEAILKSIESHPNGNSVGVKYSGGIRKTSNAYQYIALTEKHLGEEAVTSKRLRFGASSLLSDILK